ncbi:MAG: MFS transporter [Pseudomonadota bacterium]
MSSRLNLQALNTLLLLLSGVIANSAIVPFMGVFIVETLGKPPLMISVYAVITMVLTLGVNRTYGAWIDEGARVAPLILTSILAFGTGVLVILLAPGYWVLVCIASPCFAVSNGAVSAMYSFGRLRAEAMGLDVPRYNSYLRAITSLGWMIGPATSFILAGAFGPFAVFRCALALCGLWLLLWWVVMPKGFRSAASTQRPKTEPSGRNTGMLLAALVCTAIATAHVMSMSALPLYFIREAGLPTFAPGLSLSIKTGVEIVAIISTPWIMARFGARNALRFAAALAVVTFAVLSEVTTVTGLVIGSALEGLYYGVFAAVGLIFVQDFAKDRLGAATSLYMNSLFLGGILAVPLMGMAAQFISFGKAIKLSAFWAICAFAILTVMRVERVAGPRAA